jgi:hypothetical protein
MIHVGWPQGIVLGLSFFLCAVHAAKDGEPQPARKYSAGGMLFATFVRIGLLYWGGFFS